MKSSETALGIMVLTFPACMGTRWLTNNYFDYTGQINGPYNSDFMRLVFIAGIFCFINAGLVWKLAPVVVTMCKKCGRAVGEGDKKCAKCGARVKRRSQFVSDFIVLGVLLLLAGYYVKVGMDYRKRPACSRGASDMSYMSSAQKTYFADHNVFADSVQKLESIGFDSWSGVELKISHADSNSWAATAIEKGCAAARWDSAKGGLQKLN